MGSPQAQSPGRILCLAVCAFGLLLPATAHAAPEWVATYPAPNGEAENVLLGPDGSIYASGFFYGQTAGAIILRYSPSGQRLWSVQNTNIWRVEPFRPIPMTAVDSGGGVRMAGSWTGATNQLVLASYSAEGAFLWERRSIENFESRPQAIAVDTLSNTIVVGRSADVGGYEGLIHKYSSDGTLLWKRTYSREQPSFGPAHSVVVLSNNDILVGVVGSGGTGVIKFNPAGDLLWAAHAGGDGLPLELQVDRAGNIIIATGDDFYGDSLIKLNSNGQVLWRASLRDHAPSYHIPWFERPKMALDAAGNIYVAGNARLLVGIGEPVGLLVTKFDPTGRREWSSRFWGPIGDAAAGISADETGISIGSFAPVRYNHQGVEIWRETYESGSQARSMVADGTGGIYVHGGGNPLLTVKFQPQISSLLPAIISQPQHLDVLFGDNALFSVQAGNGPHTFQWRRDGTPIVGATNPSLQLTGIDLSDARSYSVIVSNAHGFVVTPDAQLTVYFPDPTIRARKTPTGLELTLQAWPGRTYRLQRRTTVGPWTDLQTFTPQSPTTTFTDNTSSQRAFYRLVTP